MLPLELQQAELSIYHRDLWPTKSTIFNTVFGPLRKSVSTPRTNMTLTRALGTEHLLTYAVRMNALNPGQALPEADLPLPQNSSPGPGSTWPGTRGKESELNSVEPRSLG